jgi:acetyl esterase
MTVNAGLAPILEAFAEFANTDWSIMPVAMARAMMDNPMATGEPLKMAQVTDLSLSLPGRAIPARFYRPLAAEAGGPLTVFFHGGGWVMGTLDTHDATCRELAEASGVSLLSVGYRLAPEAPYPLPLDDCFDACRWAKDNAAQLGIDPARLAVAGDSAGGNLAAAVAIRARDAGGPALRHQLLVYPVTDCDFDTPSYQRNGAGQYFLARSAMQWFWRHYLGDADPATAPLACVLRTDDLSGLPSATVITAEYDPLRDEGDAYAQRLAQAGIAVDHHCADGMIHGFFAMSSMVPDARPWVKQAGAKLRAALV